MGRYTVVEGEEKLKSYGGGVGRGTAGHLGRGKGIDTSASFEIPLNGMSSPRFNQPSSGPTRRGLGELEKMSRGHRLALRLAKDERITRLTCQHRGNPGYQLHQDVDPVQA